MFEITEKSPVFIIAEIGLNHDGSLVMAKDMICEAKDAGADCVKFQMRSGDLYVKTEGYKENLGSQYVKEVIEKNNLTVGEMFEAFDCCKEVGVVPLCTPWDMKSFRVLEKYGLEIYKIASADLTNHDLVQAIRNTGKWFFLSVGMSTEDEICEVIDKIIKPSLYVKDNKFVLMLCNSTYPPPVEDINLNYLGMLSKLGLCCVGYSGHELGINIAVAAVAKGAKVVEKHITLDKFGFGNDNRISLLPSEFKEMVVGIREIEKALGGRSIVLNQGELINRSNLAKSLVSKVHLNAGDFISSDIIDVKSPGRGLQPNHKFDLIGKKVCREIEAGSCFYHSDLIGKRTEARNYKFKRKWGIPVRFYDYQQLMKNTNPDFLEFHLSYKDLDEKLEDHFNQEYDIDFIVHSPDVFSNDHLLSLTHPDEYRRKKSVYELKRVIEFTRKLNKFFPNTKKPKIIVSMGGYTLNNHMIIYGRSIRWNILKRQMKLFDLSDVEILFQTLPPFPWYFGGRYYCNLFVSSIEIKRFCKETGFNLCLDLSHSQLACKHYGWDLKKYIFMVGFYIKHLHISDSEGIDGEGLQIGDGEIDFDGVKMMLESVAPDASFIPEIWMGHENDGEGFWKALEKLERIGL